MHAENMAVEVHRIWIWPDIRCFTGSGRISPTSAGHTAANPPHAAAVGECDGQTDEQADTVPFHRLRSTYYAGSANNAVKTLLETRKYRLA